ncbi:MAG TPA: cysteine desulfurase-like protein [Terriglobia bacterium]|nr:cysteine desulfurase-like protein [Terriglobia bacterium]
MSTATHPTPAHSTTTPILPVEDIRSRFPALDRRQGGHPVAYFDGPGGTQVPHAVVEAVTEYLYRHNANTHWAYPASSETDAVIAGAREAFADFMKATPSEIVFGANMTTLTFHLARALGRGYSASHEIVVTELDHHGNVAPWQALARERGVTIRVARMIAETGELDWQHFESLVNRRTKLVALGVASNALGTVNDIQKAARLAHAAGALLFADAVHSAPHLLTDVQAWDCDFLACSAYKFYGPHIGVLYGKKDLLESVDFPKLMPAPNTAPERAETGTQNHEGIAGAAAAVEFLASLAGGSSRRERLRLAFDGLHERGKALTRRLWEGLAEIPGVALYGPPPSLLRTPTVVFTVRNVASDEVARRIADFGVFLSHGDFYAASVVERLGLDETGLVRAGCACYTIAEEVERLIEGVRAVAVGA